MKNEDAIMPIDTYFKCPTCWQKKMVERWTTIDKMKEKCPECGKTGFEDEDKP